MFSQTLTSILFERIESNIIKHFLILDSNNFEAKISQLIAPPPGIVDRITTAFQRAPMEKRFSEVIKSYHDEITFIRNTFSCLYFLSGNGSTFIPPIIKIIVEYNIADNDLIDDTFQQLGTEISLRISDEKKITFQYNQSSVKNDTTQLMFSIT